MVIRHSVKELLAKDSDTRPLEYKVKEYSVLGQMKWNKKLQRTYFPLYSRYVLFFLASTAELIIKHHYRANKL